MRRGSCPRARRRPPHGPPDTHSEPSTVSVSEPPWRACEFPCSHRVFWKPRFASGGGVFPYDSVVCCGLSLHACLCGALSSTEEGSGVKAGPRAPVHGAVAASVVFLVTWSACHRSCPVMVSRLVGETCPRLVGCPVCAPRPSALREACSPLCTRMSGGDWTQPDRSVHDSKACEACRSGRL